MDTPQVFVSYRHEDKTIVEALAAKLMRRKLDIRLDRWDLLPGDSIQEALGALLQECSAVVLCIGRDGLTDWQRLEARTALTLKLNGQAVRVVPVFLPGVANDQEALPPFLRDMLTVAMSAPPQEHDFDRIAAGIGGTAAGPPPARRSSASASRLTRTPYLGLLSFTGDDREVFFGREEESRISANRILGVGKPLFRGRLLGILGPSGSGKSSLIHAGV